MDAAERGAALCRWISSEKIKLCWGLNPSSSFPAFEPRRIWLSMMDLMECTQLGIFLCVCRAFCMNINPHWCYPHVGLLEFPCWIPPLHSFGVDHGQGRWSQVFMLLPLTKWTNCRALSIPSNTSRGKRAILQILGCKQVKTGLWSWTISFITALKLGLYPVQSW